MIRDATIATPKLQVAAFSTSLGWCAIAYSKSRLFRLTFGRSSLGAAVDAMDDDDPQVDSPTRFAQRVVERIQRFAEGEADDLLDIDVDLQHLSTFATRVVAQCRRIMYGKTLTYGELAAKAKSPKAARAVGNIMANNRYPLIVPCHRVVGSSSIGGFSAPDGLQMKRRLLALEGSL